MRALAKVGLLALSIVLSFGLAEIALRLYLGEDFSPPSHRDWSFRSYCRERLENLNSLGHRDHEFSPTKPAGTFRILAVGDSITYGKGVKHLSALYTEVLERKLNATGGSICYEVLNVAQRGFNVRDHLQSIRKYGRAYQVDMVLIGFFINDIELDKNSRPKPLRLLPERLHYLFSRVSYVYWYSYSTLDGLYSGESFRDYMVSYSDEGSYDWQRFVGTWNEILHECRSNNWPVAIALLPYLNWLDER